MTATSQVAKAIEHVATDVTTQVDLLSEIANNVEVMSGDGKEMNLSVNNVIVSMWNSSMSQVMR